MKSRYFLIFIAFVLFHNLYSQSPSAMNYQAIARDLHGILLANKNLTFRISIYYNSNYDYPTYVETHAK